MQVSLHIFTKSGSTQPELHIWGHRGNICACVCWKQSMWKKVTTFALEGSLEAPTVILIDIERAFVIDDENICRPTAEVLRRATARNLSNQRRFKTGRPGTMYSPSIPHGGGRQWLRNCGRGPLEDLCKKSLSMSWRTLQKRQETTKAAVTTRTTKTRKQIWGQQNTRHCTTKWSALQLTVMTSSHYFRQLCSKHLECWWHRYHCKRTHTQQASSYSAQETTWSIRSYTRPQHKMIPYSRESSVETPWVCITQNPFSLSSQRTATQTGKFVVGTASHQHPRR